MFPIQHHEYQRQETVIYRFYRYCPLLTSSESQRYRFRTIIVIAYHKTTKNFTECCQLPEIDLCEPVYYEPMNHNILPIFKNKGTMSLQLICFVHCCFFMVFFSCCFLFAHDMFLSFFHLLLWIILWIFRFYYITFRISKMHILIKRGLSYCP